ncbi:uncharacterized protein LOC113799707 [Dermatophagoides pteronyssinus]|uniref:Uncharacterized protein LOC113799707 n=1 Tax=Dermatophagoides pteronyssinus TaxID=6956 RepID=A0A6P6YMU6_DERPT|nr:uncharacterized protein LOC113799707 [Dermatophagoides pteronyssinus]
MYALKPVYNSISPFDSNVLQTSMYPMKPYYSDIMNNFANDQQQSSSSLMEIIDHSSTERLSIPNNLDLEKDPDACMALEDLLSRQMLLLCRINDLERELIDVNDIQMKQEKFESKFIKKFTENFEDIVIHFDLDHPPTTLFKVLNFLIKDSPELFLINYHVHSSLLDDSMIKQFHMKQQNFDAKLKQINFHFNTVQDYSERMNRKIIITFIAKKLSTPQQPDDNQMIAIFKSNQPIIKGELNILHHLYSLISANNSSDEQLWKLLLSSDANLQSDQFCIEKLGRFFVNLGQRQFLFEQKQPQLIDIIIWSLADQSRALHSLMDAKWYKIIESILK